MKATVVGAGVLGLSCAVRLLERGWDVTIVAEKRTPGTTSDIAAAIHFPFLAEPKERIVPWAKATIDSFEALASDPAWGISWVETVVLGEGPERPWWADAVKSWRPARKEELPAGETNGLVAQVPVIIMPQYLARLEKDITRRGGRFVAQRLSDFSQAPKAEIVVDCAGLGARELAKDPSVHAIRGQVVRIENKGLAKSMMREHEPLAYIIPRPDCVVLGGTADPNQEETAHAPATERTILERCYSLMPELWGAAIVGRAVGLRPGRPSIRLELERVQALPVIHCYGHGGSGVTLSWGCADEVAQLAASLR